MTTMSYGGYTATVEYDEDEELFHGEVVGLRDVITFQGKSAGELKKAFKESVEDYLVFCRERGEEPEKPFSGQFVVRTSPSIHRSAVLAAKKEGISLNTWVIEAIETRGGQIQKNSLRPGSRVMRRSMTKRAG